MRLPNSRLAAMCVAVLLFFALAPMAAQAQSGTLKLTGGTTAADGTASLDLSFSAGTGARPASLEWAFAYAPGDFQSFTVTPGMAVTGAGKTLSCAWQAGEYHCIASGPNDTMIADGVVASVRVALAANVTASSVGVNQSLGASPDAAAISFFGTGASLTVPVTLTGFSCNAVSMTTPGSVLCAVSLNRAAASAGATVSLGSSSPYLQVPSSVTVPSGSSSASFTGNASAVTTTGTAVITASFSGVSKTASVQLQAAPPAATISSLSCSPSSLSAGGSSTCTVTISRAAVSTDPAVALASNNGVLGVPASLVVPVGATTVNFTAKAGTVTASTTAQVTATWNGISKSASITVAPAPVAPPPVPVSLSCSPSALISNQSTSCTVQLSAAAPSGGAVVAIATSGSILRAPSSITIAAGASSGTFVATSGWAPRPLKVGVMAQLNRITVSTVVRVGVHSQTN